MTDSGCAVEIAVAGYLQAAVLSNAGAQAVRTDSCTDIIKQVLFHF